MGKIVKKEDIVDGSFQATQNDFPAIYKGGYTRSSRTKDNTEKLCFWRSENSDMNNLDRNISLLDEFQYKIF